MKRAPTRMRYGSGLTEPAAITGGIVAAHGADAGDWPVPPRSRGLSATSLRWFSLAPVPLATRSDHRGTRTARWSVWLWASRPARRVRRQSRTRLRQGLRETSSRRGREPRHSRPLAVRALLRTAGKGALGAHVKRIEAEEAIQDDNEAGRARSRSQRGERWRPIYNSDEQPIYLGPV